MFISGQFIISLCFVLWLSIVDASPLVHHNKDRCHHVRQLHQKYQHQQPHHYSRLISDICPNISNGCCSGLEFAIENKTRVHFAQDVLAHLAQFKAQYSARELRVVERIQSLMRESVERVYREHPGYIADENRQLIDSARQLLYHSRTVDIDTHVDRLLQAIVIEELKKTHNLSADYLQCVFAVKYGDIFEDTRAKLTQNIYNAIESSRFILQSFKLASELLGRAEKVKLTDDCVRHLARNLHCDECLSRDSPARTRPCASTCRAVISQCMVTTEMKHIDEAWRSVSNSFNQLVESVVVHHNPETIFEQLPNEINRALGHIFEKERSKSEILKKTRVSCGPIQKSSISQFASATDENMSYDHPNQYSSFTESLFVSLQSAAHMLEKNKDIFNNLENKLCQQISDNDCLDSRSSTSLHQTLPDKNISTNQGDQFYDRIKRFRSSIDTITISHLKLNNNTVYSYDSIVDQDGSGSGKYSDDEDSDDDTETDASGDKIDSNTDETSNSGMTDGTTDSGITFTNPFESPTSSNHPVGVDQSSDSAKTGSSSFSSQPNCLLLLISLFVLLYTCTRCKTF